jgi:hypothetical protein
LLLDLRLAGAEFLTVAGGSQFSGGEFLAVVTGGYQQAGAEFLTVAAGSQLSGARLLGVETSFQGLVSKNAVSMVFSRLE